MGIRPWIDEFPHSRVGRAWHEGGVWLIVARAVRQLLGPAAGAGSIEFFARDLRTSIAETGGGDLVIEEAGPEAAPRLIMDRPAPHQVADEIERRFARGDRCIVARDASGRYLHSRWISISPTYIPELGLYIAPGAGQAYFYDGYTHPEARGRGVDGAVRTYIFAAARQAGCREVLSYVRGDNLPGLKAASKWQTPIGGVRFVALPGLRPLVIGRRRLASRVELLAPAVAAEREAARRARATALQAWFQSWLTQPMAKRSTGYAALPEAYFASAARHLVDTLRLDPRRDRTLDVGCSSGVISRRVAPFCRRFVGVDVTIGLLTDIPAGWVTAADGHPAGFAAADGGHLPFRERTFDKVYSSGVIHMLPGHDDALRLIDEMVRVCRPGGMVLVGAVPDVARRPQARRLVWRNAGTIERAKLAVALLLPRRVKRAVRRLAGLRPSGLAFLEFDMAALAARFEAQGLDAEVLDYPDDYWSEDFRTARSNLLLKIPR